MSPHWILMKSGCYYQTYQPVYLHKYPPTQPTNCPSACLYAHLSTHNHIQDMYVAQVMSCLVFLNIAGTIIVIVITITIIIITILLLRVFSKEEQKTCQHSRKSKWQHLCTQIYLTGEYVCNKCEKLKPQRSLGQDVINPIVVKEQFSH